MKIWEDKSFKEITTFHIGGKIKYYVEVKTRKESEEAICFAKSNNLQIFIIGNGSDFLANDKPFDGLVIKYAGSNFSINGDYVTGEAGMIWDHMVEISVKNNLQGIECLTGIPGTVGASPVQNIGAYGQELADTFYKLTAYDIEKGEYVDLNREDCHFGYRQSIFKEKSHWQKFLILGVTLKLNKGARPNMNYKSLKEFVGNNPTLEEVRRAVLKVRGEKLENPIKVGNAGSFFQNPIINLQQKNILKNDFPEIKVFPFGNRYKVSAAWLIENAGWKGKKYREAGVSEKHSLILINPKGQATSEDVYKLSEKIISDVYKKFGVKLDREVQLINFSNGGF